MDKIVKKRPKPKIPNDVRVEELKKHEIFDNVGKLKKEKDSVWDDVCANLKKITPNGINKRNLYNYVSTNKNKILNELTIQESLSCTSNESRQEAADYPDTEHKLILLMNNVLYKSTFREFSV